ncbi:unnamed protein product [Dimorphilus gyrociliatus]|uniref:C2H2-type domain-containing protein n=1 Tax=Dimorphilus gyrociliatus TaxID=2664684 RepID=A0A7I8VZY9_9ANNE|nr:unnamed protein product [Dimorphilus gyrociliatus]
MAASLSSSDVWNKSCEIFLERIELAVQDIVKDFSDNGFHVIFAAVHDKYNQKVAVSTKHVAQLTNSIFDQLQTVVSQEETIPTKVEEADLNCIELEIVEDVEKRKRARKTDVLSCDYCGYKALYERVMEIHKRKHTGDKPYKCDQCSKHFKSENTLSRHKQEIHDQIRNWKCDICNSAFFNKYSLTHHALVHTGERKYSCNMCSKSFMRKGHLVAHKKAHLPSDKKEFKCSDCNAVYAYKSSLREHILRHTGEKPHKCEMCDESFRYRWQLKRHRLSVHGKVVDRPYICKICGLACVSDTTLRIHTTRVHEANNSNVTETVFYDTNVDGIVDVESVQHDFDE